MLLKYLLFFGYQDRFQKRTSSVQKGGTEGFCKLVEENFINLMQKTISEGFHDLVTSDVLIHRTKCICFSETCICTTKKALKV